MELMILFAGPGELTPAGLAQRLLQGEPHLVMGHRQRGAAPASAVRSSGAQWAGVTAGARGHGWLPVAGMQTGRSTNQRRNEHTLRIRSCPSVLSPSRMTPDATRWLTPQMPFPHGAKWPPPLDGAVVGHFSHCRKVCH